MDVPVGRNVYTPVLSPEGGFKSDLTIMRLGDEHFRVVTGGAAGMSDKKWFRDHLAEGAQLADLTSAMTTIGLWGPRARDILASTTADNVSNEGFKFGACRVIEIGTQRVLASRISYVGDLGWELYVPMEQGHVQLPSEVAHVGDARREHALGADLDHTARAELEALVGDVVRCGGGEDVPG